RLDVLRMPEVVAVQRAQVEVGKEEREEEHRRGAREQVRGGAEVARENARVLLLEDLVGDAAFSDELGHLSAPGPGLLPAESPARRRHRSRTDRSGIPGSCRSSGPGRAKAVATRSRASPMGFAQLGRGRTA